MPFTFSHPAAVLPAKFFPEKWVSMTALVIGSTTPDFEYFIRMRNVSLYSHSWVGIFWFDLPIAFGLTFVYHLFIRDSLIDNLPFVLRKRLSKYKGFNWAGYVKQHFWIVIISLTIGITTHVVWDAFTHRSGYFVMRIPWLLKNTEIFGIGHVRFYILQQISSVAGLLIVLYALFRIPADEDIEKRSIFKYWLIAGCITALTVTVRIYIGLNYHLPIEAAKRLLTPDFYSVFYNFSKAEDVIMSLISAFLLSLVITPYLIRQKA